MSEETVDVVRLATVIEGQRPPAVMGEVIGLQAADGSARGKGHEERLKDFEEKQNQANSPKKEEAHTQPDAEDILRSAGFKVAPLAADGDPDAGWSQTPTLKTQYTDPRFASTVSVGPETYDQFDLSQQTHKDKLNALKRRASKAGAPQVDIIMERPDFSPNLGSYIVFVIYREIFYRSIIEIK